MIIILVSSNNYVINIVMYLLKIAHWNINGLKNKKLHEEISKFDLICITETWLTSQTGIHVPGYKTFHQPAKK